MNGDTKVLEKNPVPTPVPNNVILPQGSSSKEKAPVEQNLSEFVRPAGPEISPSPSTEEKESGVEVKNDRPDLTQVTDMKHAGPHVSVSAMSSSSTQYSVSEEEIARKRTGKIDDSETWNATLLDKVIKAGKLVGKILGF